MNRRIAPAVLTAALALGAASAYAGPCTDRIAQFEREIRQSAGNPNAGPMAAQTVGAQMDRQPTPASIRRAKARAEAKFKATLARAKRFDAKGDLAACTHALDDAEAMYNF